MSQIPTVGGIANMNIRVAAGSYDIGSLLTTWVDVVHVDYKDDNGVIDTTPGQSFSNAKIGKNFLVEAFSNPAIPGIGDLHPIYLHTYCQSVRIEPAPATTGTSPISVRYYVTWIAPTQDENGYSKVKTDIEVFQSQEIANYDAQGNLTKVYYNLPAGSSGQQDATIWNKYRICDIRLPKLTKSFRVTLYEDFAAKNSTNQTQGAYVSQIAGLQIQPNTEDPISPRPFYNSDRIWGFEPSQLLFVGRRASNDVTQIFRCEYQYLINERGWNKWFSVFENQNGVIPQNIAEFPKDYLNVTQKAPGSPDGPPLSDLKTPALNGLGVFDMLKGGPFKEIFNNIHIPGNKAAQ